MMPKMYLKVQKAKKIACGARCVLKNTKRFDFSSPQAKNFAFFEIFPNFLATNPPLFRNHRKQGGGVVARNVTDS